jgi:hypothetical protein
VSGTPAGNTEGQRGWAFPEACAIRVSRIGDMLKTLEKTNASATRSPSFPSMIGKDQIKKDRP